MRILFAHNYYQHAGGEDTVVGAELAMLAAAGHETALYSVSNDTIRGSGAKLRTALTTRYNAAARDQFAARLKQFGPDVVHVHNFFPLLTPAIFDACANAGIAVVLTLHNYRLTCGSALLMREGAVCEKCVSGSAYWGAFHRCYRGSLPGSAVLSHMIAHHKRAGTWANKVDRFIALTDFAKRKFVAAGVPEDRIAVKANFVVDPGAPGDAARKGALFVGRLSEEKGVRDLVDAWGGVEQPLRVVGSGPLEGELRARAPSNVTFLGKLAAERVREEMSTAACLVVPSKWYEGFPMVIIESYAAGTPVIVSKLGALPEIVGDGITGLHARAGDVDDIRETVLCAFGDPEQLRVMGSNARACFVESYTPAQNLPQLEAIYAAAQADPSHARRASHAKA